MDELQGEWQALSKELSWLKRPQDMPRRVEVCRRLLSLSDRARQPELWAALNVELANSLAQNPLGERAENVEQAIQHYQQALEVYTREAFPFEWAMTQDNLGNAYRNRLRGESAENIEQAIQCFQQALEVYTRQDFSSQWAMTQNNLGVAYRNRMRGRRDENVELAIQHYHQALEVYTRQDFPYEWAGIQNNLGNAYADRIRGERAENVELAIQHYQRALEVRTRQAFPSDWATTQNNLGNAYRNRIRGERAENVELAIQHYQRALEVRTRQAFPEQWATTHNNLGNAYRERIRGERAENVELAIQHFQRALEVRTRQAFPSDWAMTHNNLGNAYAERIRGERDENVELAIQHFQQALEVYTRQDFPSEWAGVQGNLGNAYLDRVRGERAENVELAIQHYQRALEVYTCQDFPQDWAGIQNNLGNAYADRIRGEHAENVELAIQHYQQALEVLTPAGDPLKCRTTGRRAGRLCLEAGRWQAAAESLENAVAADQALYQAALSLSGREYELSAGRGLHAWAAYAQAKAGNGERAVELLEAGRARLLREALEQNRRDLERLEALGCGELLRAYRQASQKFTALSQQAQASPEAPRPAPAKAMGADLFHQRESAQQELQAAIAAIRQAPGYEDFLRPLSAERLHRLAGAAPLVYLAVTPFGGLALVVTAEAAHPVWLPALSEAALQGQVIGEAGEPAYLRAYLAWRVEPSNPTLRQRWIEALDATTAWLWAQAMQPLTEKLSTLLAPEAEVVLIPAGLLGLLPLHAAWRADAASPTGRRYVLDDFCYTYAPSAHALEQARARLPRPAESLLMVDDPTETLTFAPYEAESALGFFPADACKHLRGRQARLLAVLAEMPRWQVLHFSTHGEAGFTQPLEGYLQMAQDEALTLRQVLDLRLEPVRLALLSACETGVVGLNLPDEVIGLPSGFVQAGAPGVVGSLWSVDDASTMLLMNRFYELWKQDGKPPAQALRQAQIWLRDRPMRELAGYLRQYDSSLPALRMSGAAAVRAFWEVAQNHPDERIYQSPYYWAAFTFTGV